MASCWPRLKCRPCWSSGSSPPPLFLIILPFVTDTRLPARIHFLLLLFVLCNLLHGFTFLSCPPLSTQTPLPPPRSPSHSQILSSHLLPPKPSTCPSRPLTPAACPLAHPGTTCLVGLFLPRLLLCIPFAPDLHIGVTLTRRLV